MVTKIEHLMQQKKEVVEEIDRQLKLAYCKVNVMRSVSPVLVLEMGDSSVYLCQQDIPRLQSLLEEVDELD